MKYIKFKTHIFAKELLQFSLITYVVLILAETYKEGFVSYYFNLYILLGICIILGAIVVFTYDKKEQVKPQKKSVISIILFSAVMAIVGAILIYDRTVMLGTISFVIAGISGIIILLFCLLIFSNRSTS